MNKNIIEVVTFQVKNGVSETQLLELSHAFGDALKREIDGFIKRSLTKKYTEDKIEDQWIELIWWDSMESAQIALEKMPKTIEFQEYASALKDDDSEIFYLEENQNN